MADQQPPPDTAVTSQTVSAPSETAPAAAAAAAPIEAAAPGGDAPQPAAGAAEQATGPATDANEPIAALPANADDLLKEFYSEVRSVDRDNEVNRIIGSFRLNAFEQLGVRFDATAEEIRREFRKLSLLVHPDKCTHPRAKDAFDIVNSANKKLQNEDVRKEILHVLNLAKDEVRKERRKKVKNDAPHRLASMLHKDGVEGVEAEYEQTAEFHDAWKAKSRDMLAKAEWRRRKLTARLKDEEHREEEDEAETREKLKAMRDHHKNWESSRDKRVGTWRDFAAKKSKKQKTKAVGGIKPPKLKEEDGDKTYVQRPAVEAFRPAGQFTVHKPQRE